MKKWKRVILIICFIIQWMPAFGQENYMNGYLVDNSGDTIKGEVDYQNWGSNPDKIIFRLEGQNASKTYTPLEISSFFVAGEYYYSGIVQAEKSPQTTMNITQDSEFKFQMDTTFLQALVIGDKSLFHYTDKEDRNNFYISTDSGFQILQFKWYLISHNGVLLKQSSKSYIRQLLNYLDCEGLRDKIIQIEYSKRSLTRIFQEYYLCKGQKEYYLHE